MTAKRTFRSLLAVGLVAVAAPAVAGMNTASGSLTTDDVPKFLDCAYHRSRQSACVFSPNGDGVRDQIAVRYRLLRAGQARLSVTGPGSAGPRFKVRLGRKAAGSHAWMWNGRTPGGRRVPEGRYLIRLHTPEGQAWTWVEVDTKFRVLVDVAQRYGRPTSEVPHVYPRSVAVRDSIKLAISATPVNAELQKGVLTIRHRAGRVVARKKVPVPLNLTRIAWDARDRRERPLPPGRYLASLSGVDRAGNEGRSKPIRLRVSGDRLVWREETRVLAPQATHWSNCDWSGTLDCRDYYQCGSIEPSSRLPGGLTHRAGVCHDTWRHVQRAESQHFVPVDEAVRGVEAIRVSFAGAPTNPGETDPGHLYTGFDVQSTVSSTSGAQTPWDYDPYLGDGWDEDLETVRRPAGALWNFWTGGSDAFDVGTFTLDMRYLAPTDAH